MPKSVDLVTSFRGYTDEQFATESKRSLVTNQDFDWTGAHSVKVFKLSTGNMNDYNRAATGGGSWSLYGNIEELNAGAEEFTLTKDRSFIFNVDKLDTDETAGQLAAASALARQNREKVVPEVDAYTYAVMCAGAGTVAAAALTSSNIYDKIVEANQILDDAKVPETGRVLIVTPATHVLMKKCSDITMNTDIGNDMRLKGVIANLDGLNVQKIISAELPAGFGFMIAHPCATVAPQKLEDFNVHNDTIYSSGSVVTGRVAYGAFVLDNKKMALYVMYTTANGLKVTSEAGSTSGKTKITVDVAKASGNSYVYKTASSVDMPLTLDVLSSGWTSWDGSADITATTGHDIVIAEIDSNNKCIKAGKATVTSKA